MGRPEGFLDPGLGPVSRFAFELRALREAAGAPGYRELARRAHYSVATLSQAASGNALPSLPVALAYVRACGGDEDEWRARWHEASAELTPAEDNDLTNSPYLGLASFQPMDADRFFGRAELVAELRRRVDESSFLAVLGPSGSGKSSLLRAGLLPALSRHTGWSVTVLTPGPHPVLPLDTADLVVVVDQFEEVFTLCESEDERAEFLDRIADAAADPGVRVVLGMRADFLGHCARYPRLVDALRDRQVLVGPMAQDDLRAVIREPAARAGLSVEAALVERILTDAGTEPGTLPLVSHALLETWKRRQGRTMTLAGYLRAGGVRGGIAHTADRVYDELDPAARRIAKDIFLRLTAVGEGVEHTRRRVPWDELVGSADGEAAASVLARLASARLVTVDTETVEVAHEALIREWPRLRSWLADDRETVLAHRRLTEAAADWERHDRDESLLYRGARLAGWQDRALDRLNDAEHAFLAASHGAVRRAQRGRRRRVGQVIGALTAATVVVTVLAVMALLMAARADDERALAVSRQLVSDARAQLAVDPELALLLAREAYTRNPNTETEAVLRQAVADSRVRATLPLPKDAAPEAVSGVAFSADGGHLVVSSPFGGLWIWDWADGHVVGEPRVPAGVKGQVHPMVSPDGRDIAAVSGTGVVVTRDWAGGGTPTVLPGYEHPVRDIAFGPDGRVAAAGMDGAVRIWRDAGQPEVLPGDQGLVNAVAFSSNGRSLASAGENGTVVVRDLTGASPPAMLRGHRGWVTTVAFAPDGRHLVSAGLDGAVRLWDLALEVSSVLGSHEGTVASVAYSRDGRSVLSTGGASVRIWNTDVPAAPLVLRGHHGAVLAAAFSPDGRAVVSGSTDGTAKVWDIAPVDTEIPLAGHEEAAVWGTALSQDGERAASAGPDGAVRVWDMRGGEVVLTGLTGPASAAVFSPDGERVAAMGADGVVAVWDLVNPTVPLRLGKTAAIPLQLAFGPDGTRLAAATGSTSLWVWDLADPRQAAALVGGGDSLTGVAWAADGRLAATSASGNVLTWERDGDFRPTMLRGRMGQHWQLAFSHDSTRLASTSVDGNIRIWNVRTKEPPVVFRDRQGTVWHATFSRDDRSLITTGGDATIRLWRTDGTGEPLVLGGFRSPARAVAVLAGDRYVTAHDDGAVRVWRCTACGPVATVLARVPDHVTRALTDEERRTYLD